MNGRLRRGRRLGAMPRLPTLSFKCVLAALAVLGAAAIAALFAGGKVVAVRTPAAAPAETVALRFPAEWNDREAVPAELTEPDAATLAMFGQATFGYVTHEPLTAGPMFSPPVYVPSATQPGNAVPSPPTPQARPRAVARTPAVFNDAQIASIKGRLNLTREQLRHWPAVERALRALAWQKGQGAAQPATLDAARVQRLQAAIGPLAEVLDAEQKRELQMLAHISGLGRVAAQF